MQLGELINTLVKVFTTALAVHEPTLLILIRLLKQQFFFLELLLVHTDNTLLYISHYMFMNSMF